MEGQEEEGRILKSNLRTVGRWKGRKTISGLCKIGFWEDQERVEYSEVI